MGNLDVIENKNVPPNNMDFTPVPKGRYRMFCSEQEVKPTSSGSGLLLKTTFDVTEPGYEGKKIFHNFNIVNQNEKAQNIGRGMLSSLSKALGMTSIPDDGSDLLDKEFIGSVDIEEGSGGYEAKNVVKGFFPITGKVERKATVKTEANVPEDNNEEVPF